MHPSLQHELAKGLNAIEVSEAKEESTHTLTHTHAHTSPPHLTLSPSHPLPQADPIRGASAVPTLIVGTSRGSLWLAGPTGSSELTGGRTQGSTAQHTLQREQHTSFSSNSGEHSTAHSAASSNLSPSSHSGKLLPSPSSQHHPPSLPLHLLTPPSHSSLHTGGHYTAPTMLAPHPLHPKHFASCGTDGPGCYCGPPLMQRPWVARRRRRPRTAWPSQRTEVPCVSVCVCERERDAPHPPPFLLPPPLPPSFLLLLSPPLLPSLSPSFSLSLSQAIATEPFVFISCHHHHGSQSKASGPHCGSSQCQARPAAAVDNKPSGPQQGHHPGVGCLETIAFSLNGENSCLITCGGHDRTIRVLELRFLGGAGGNNDGASSSNGASGLGSLTARTASSGALSARGSSGAPLSARSSTTVSGGAISSARPSSAASSTVSAGRGGTAATTSSVSGRGKDSCASPWDPLTSRRDK